MCQSWNICDVIVDRVPACSLDAYERVVDAIFSMPSDLLNQDEVPGTPNSLQVPLCLF